MLIWFLVALSTISQSTEGDGATALHRAALNNDLEIARLLIKSGARVDAVTRIGELTPLYLAAGAGNAAMVAELLNAGANARATNSVSGTTALMKAAGSGSADAVKLLLDHGADVNAKETGLDQTAAMFAAAADRADVISVLASHGADLKATSKVTHIQPQKDLDSDDFPLDADLILHANLPPGKEAAAAALAGRRAVPTVSGGMTALLLAARDGRLAATRALLDAGADVNQPSAGDKTTPLIMAIVNGHFDTAKVLLDLTADPNATNQDGLAALYATIDAQWAPVAGGPVPLTAREKTTYLDLMKALLEHGANPDARLGHKLWFRPTFHDQMWIGTPGSTAFWRAAQATDVSAMRLLKSHGADPRVPSDEGDTALMLASGVGWAGNFSRNAPDSALEAAKFCLDAGLDVNTQDVTGYTALMGAAWRGDNDLVKLLVERGAKLDARTHRGWSATDMATGPYLRTTGATPHPDTVALLLKLGAPALTPHPNEDILGLVTPDVPPADHTPPQAYLDTLPAAHPSIHYWDGASDDAGAHLARELRNGQTEVGDLTALLKYFGINPDSQALVFSKSSFQSAKISPRNPRAIYFNDEVAVGYVRGGAGMEVTAVDPQRGVVFYTFDVDTAGKPSLTRREVCLKCHQGTSTLGVPGIFVGSVFPNAEGMPARKGAIVTDHRSAFADRWGGWYVNAAHGEQPDRANAVASDPDAPEELHTLPMKFSPAGYLSATSDIVALMTFEHQTQMTNFITRLGWEARMGDRPIDSDLEALVSYMLFTDEAPLREPIEGVSSFTKTFPERGPRDSKGRSLRDFDLRTRLFRYPLSYMIYSRAFDALPDPVRLRVYRRLRDELAARHRGDALEILRETKAGLPDFW
jgi:ankyrin repeat protein